MLSDTLKSNSRIATISLPESLFSTFKYGIFTDNLLLTVMINGKSRAISVGDIYSNIFSPELLKNGCVLITVFINQIWLVILRLLITLNSRFLLLIIISNSWLIKGIDTNKKRLSSLLKSCKYISILSL
jgi:hypothetical protein